MGNEVNKHDPSKNNKGEQAKKKPIPPPPRVGRKKKNKGIDAAAKLPSGITLIIKLLQSLSADSGSSNYRESKTTSSCRSNSLSTIRRKNKLNLNRKM